LRQSQRQQDGQGEQFSPRNHHADIFSENRVVPAGKEDTTWPNSGHVLR
jgi:hypothetical protein